MKADDLRGQVPSGLGRRATDRVSSSHALELVCTLAYEHAINNPGKVNLEAVEAAIAKVRALQPRKE